MVKSWSCKNIDDKCFVCLVQESWSSLSRGSEPIEGMQRICSPVFLQIEVDKGALSWPRRQLGHFECMTVERSETPDDDLRMTLVQVQHGNKSVQS